LALLTKVDVNIFFINEQIDVNVFFVFISVYTMISINLLICGYTLLYSICVLVIS